MGDIVQDEVTSPDIGRPRFLFRRYNSVSGSSDSCRSSLGSSSRGSYLQSPRKHNDEQTRRTRTTTWPCTENTSFTDESPSNVSGVKGRERSNGITNIDIESPDGEDTCIFCDTLVYERQYYLWHSQYTKSSLCTRCSHDNDGMRYISYWGTPSYEIGSWRKRYRAGRSTDIDLSPLLEVLERIDRIDTSIDGRKSAKYKNDNECHDDNNNITIPMPDLECFDIKDSDEMDARRRRRLENRKVIEGSNVVNNNFEIKKKMNFSIVRQGTTTDVRCTESNESKTTFRGKRKHGNFVNSKNKDEKDIEYTISEMDDNTEAIDVIEPLNVINVTEKIPADKCVNECFNETENSRIVSQDIASKTLNREDTLSAENILNYRKQRRKSNYEEFLAGLEPVTQFKRRSSAALDLKHNLYGKKDDDYTPKIMINGEEKSESIINDVTAVLKGNDSNDAPPKDTYSTIHNDDRCAREFKNKDTERQHGNTKHKNNKVKRKLKRKKTSYLYETNEPVTSSSQSVTDANTSPLSSNRKRLSKTVLQVNDICPDNESSDETNCNKSSFSDIKHRFEHLSKGTTFQNGKSEFQGFQANVSKGNFRSRYMKKAERVNDFNSDDELENCDGVNACSLNRDDKTVPKKIQNYMKEDLKTENIEINQNRVTDDSEKQSQDMENVKDITAVETERTYCLINDKNCNGLTDNEPRLAENNRKRFAENFDRSEKCKRKSSASSPSTIPDINEKARLFKDVSLMNKNKSNIDQYPCSESTSESKDFVSVEPSFKGSLSDSNDEVEDRSTSKLLLNNNVGLDEHRHLSGSLKGKEHNKRMLCAREREKKYKQYGGTEHENPDIERIKKKLSRKPKYEDDDSNSEELNDVIMELNGSDNEEVELGWRTRGYNTDFYMSRRSVTGGEILDRYKRAISNRRSKRNSRENSRKSSKNSVISNNFANIMTHSEPVSRGSLQRQGTSSYSAPISRSNTQSKLSDDDTQYGECSGYRKGDTNSTGGKSGVSASALKAALDRATSCSERLSQRIKSQLQPSDSYDSSS